MRRALATIVGLCLLLSPAGTSAALEIPVVGPDATFLGEPTALSHWAQTPDWYFGNMGTGFSRAKWDGQKTRLEAQSICLAGRSKMRADAKATWRFRAGVSSFTLAFPDLDVWGQLITTPAPGGITGDGGGQVKLTFTVTDVTENVVMLESTYLDEEPPTVILDAIVKGETLEKRVVGSYGHMEYFPLQYGHIYEAEVKLWTFCWAWGMYHSRTDFSAGTIDTPQNPLIGMVLLRGLQFDFLRQAGGRDGWQDWLSL